MNSPVCIYFTMYFLGLWLFELTNSSIMTTETVVNFLILCIVICVFLFGISHPIRRLSASLFVLLGCIAMYYGQLNVNQITDNSCFSENDFCEIEVMRVKTHSSGKSLILNVKHPCNAQLIKTSCYLDSSNHVLLQPGLILLAYGNLKVITNKNNPNEFNKRQYYLSKGITHSFHLKSDSVIRIDTLVNIHTIANRMKNIVSEQVRPLSENKRVQAMSYALLFAEKQFLTNEDLKMFSNSGTMHVLAISGMHMGLLFWTISILLRGLKILNIPSWFIHLLSIILMFLFTVMVGMGVSVTRAFIMISFIQISKMLNRSSNSLLALSAAGFFILLNEPFAIYDIGFQLSFSAVACLILIRFPLLTIIKSPVLRVITGLISATIVAQLGTTPIVLYHFDQFPIYFLLANLIVVPLIMAFMYALLSYLVIYPFEFLQEGVIMIIRHLTKGLFFTLEWLSMLPYTAITGINFTQFMVMIGLIGLVILALSKNMMLQIPTYVWLALAICLCWNMFLSQLQRINSNGYVLNTQGIFLMCIKTKQQTQILTHQVKRDNNSHMVRFIEPLVKSMNIGNIKHVNLDSIWSDAGSFQVELVITSNGERIVILGNVPMQAKAHFTFCTDYLVLTGNAQLKYEQLQELFTFQKLIVADINRGNKMYWTEIAKVNQHVILVFGKGSFPL